MGSSSKSEERRRLPTACTQCRQRKIKCASVAPCSFCVARGLDCVFRPLTNEERETERAYREALVPKKPVRRGRPEEDDRQFAFTNSLSPPQSTTAARDRFGAADAAAQKRNGSSSPQSQPAHQSPQSDRMVDCVAARPIKQQRCATSPLDALDPSATSSSSSLSSSSSSRPSPPPVISMICTPDLRCLRVSDESLWLLGRDPSSLEGIPLESLVHPVEVYYLSKLQDRLMASQPAMQLLVETDKQQVPHPLVIEHFPASLLARPLLGTPFPSATMRLRTSSGLYDFFDVRLHLASPFQGDQPLVVASLLRYGQDVISHPSIDSLNAPPGTSLADDPRTFSSRHFYSPNRLRQPHQDRSALR